MSLSTCNSRLIIKVVFNGAQIYKSIVLSVNLIAKEFASTIITYYYVHSCSFNYIEQFLFLMNCNNVCDLSNGRSRK